MLDRRGLCARQLHLYAHSFGSSPREELDEWRANAEPALLFKSRSEAETYLASNQVPDDLWLILVEGDPSVEDGFDLYVHSLTWAGKQPVLAKNSALISCVRGG